MRCDFIGASGESEVPTVVVPDLQFAQKPVPALEAALLFRRNIQADGILGTDCLAHDRVEFDFDTDTMSIARAGVPDWDERAVVVTARRLNGRLS